MRLRACWARVTRAAVALLSQILPTRLGWAGSLIMVGGGSGCGQASVGLVQKTTTRNQKISRLDDDLVPLAMKLMSPSSRTEGRAGVVEHGRTQQEARTSAQRFGGQHLRPWRPIANLGTHSSCCQPENGRPLIGNGQHQQHAAGSLMRAAAPRKCLQVRATSTVYIHTHRRAVLAATSRNPIRMSAMVACRLVAGEEARCADIDSAARKRPGAHAVHKHATYWVAADTQAAPNSSLCTWFSTCIARTTTKSPWMAGNSSSVSQGSGYSPFSSPCRP